MVGVDGTSLVDFRGMPVDKSRTGGWLAAGLMLGTELSERICVMGIAMNLVTYLVGDLHLSAARSANTVTNFMGTLNLLGLLGGFLADARLGRYLTVAISATIAALGVTLLTAATTIPSMRPPPCENSRTQQCVAANGHQLALLYAALYTIALGGGGIKANVSGFGTDQFDSSDPKEGKKMIVFFNRFYFCISLGSLFAVTVLVYIQDNVGRDWGYGISAATMIIAVAIFLLGSPVYRFRRPEGSPLSLIWRVGFLSWKKRRVPYPSQNQLLNGYSNATVAHTHKLRCLDKAAIIEEIDDKCNYNCSTVTEVEEVKMVMMLLPIWCTCILFWTIYSQMNTFTIEQATLMNRKIGTFEVPAGSFSFFLFITILIFTFLNERILLPIFRKINGGITCLRCIGIGLIFSVAGMVVAAAVEVRRRGAFANGNVRITAFWLVPQFFLVGAGEAFAYVGQLQFFITEAPHRMKSMSTGLFLATLSMGYFMSSLLVSIVEAATSGRWLRSNLNAARLENFYGMLSVLGVVNFMAFLVFATKHQYKIKSTDHQNAIENA